MFGQLFDVINYPFHTLPPLPNGLQNGFIFISDRIYRFTGFTGLPVLPVYRFYRFTGFTGKQDLLVLIFFGSDLPV
jgi:hypothetical protein